MTDPYPWIWEVHGVERRARPGAMIHGMDDTGTINAEGSGDALAQLLQTGPFWDMLDQDEHVTITLRPADQ